MNTGNPIARFLLVITLACLAPVLPALAQDGVARAGEEAPFDWMHHTQDTLNELRTKLNLAPGQLTAWDAWSTGVLGDAQTQLSRKMLAPARAMHTTAAPAEDTTPERMARGIERLRAQALWMQGHLVRLETALARTRTFYETLDTNQKTIFDLFWHEIHHRAFGHDDDAELRRDAADDPMADGRDAPPGAY